MADIRTARDICYAAADKTELLLDLYLPQDNAGFPLLVFFHGGGLEEGGKEDVSRLAAEFAQNGIGVAVPNYRLLPRVSFRECIRDAAASVGWAEEHRRECGGTKGLFVGGHSAGAYLSMMLCFDKSYLAARDIDAGAINGYIFASGQPTTHFNVLKHRGDDPRRVIVDEAAALYYVRSAGAPMQILCADSDMENRLEQTQLLVSTLRHYQYENEVDFHILKGYDHGNYLEPDKGGHSKLYSAASPFIRKHMTV